MNTKAPTIYLYPAYGRTYTKVKDLREDWIAGKDFKILNGPYTSIRDLHSLESDYNIIYIFTSRREEHSLKIVSS